MGSSEHSLQHHRSGWPLCATYDPYVAGVQKANSQIPGPTLVGNSIFSGSGQVFYSVLLAPRVNGYRLRGSGLGGAGGAHSPAAKPASCLRDRCPRPAPRVFGPPSDLAALGKVGLGVGMVRRQVPVPTASPVAPP